MATGLIIQLKDRTSTSSAQVFDYPITLDKAVICYGGTGGAGTNPINTGNQTLESILTTINTRISTINSSYLPIAGGTLTGGMTLSGNTIKANQNALTLISEYQPEGNADPLSTSLIINYDGTATLGGSRLVTVGMLANTATSGSGTFVSDVSINSSTGLITISKATPPNDDTKYTVGNLSTGTSDNTPHYMVLVDGIIQYSGSGELPYASSKATNRVWLYNGKLYVNKDGSDPSSTPTASKYEVATAQDITDAMATANALTYKGLLPSGSPVNDTMGYSTPAGNKGDVYKVSTACKINGVLCEVGDMLICNDDNVAVSAANNYSTIKTKWDVIQGNLDGAAMVVKGSGTADASSNTSWSIAAWDNYSSNNTLKNIKSIGNAYTPIYLDSNGKLQEIVLGDLLGNLDNSYPKLGVLDNSLKFDKMYGGSGSTDLAKATSTGSVKPYLLIWREVVVLNVTIPTYPSSLPVTS